MDFLLLLKFFRRQLRSGKQVVVGQCEELSDHVTQWDEIEADEPGTREASASRDLHPSLISLNKRDEINNKFARQYLKICRQNRIGRTARKDVMWCAVPSDGASAQELASGQPRNDGHDTKPRA